MAEHEPRERVVGVPPERLAGFVRRFRERHGGLAAAVDDAAVRLTATDGATAVVEVPFPPLPVIGNGVDALLDHVRRERTVGAVLVRKGGYAVGVFTGRRLLASKVGSLYVQGRTKAGGWSQQRYARRRDKQARQLYAETADAAVHVLLPRLPDLEAVVTGGDRAAVLEVLGDPRLSDLAALVTGRTHPVPDPRLRVLQQFPDQFLTVQVRLNALA